MFITLSQIASYLGMNLKMSFGGDLHASLQLPKNLWSLAQTLLKKKGGTAYCAHVLHCTEMNCKISFLELHCNALYADAL